MRNFDFHALTAHEHGSNHPFRLIKVAHARV